MEKLKIPPMYRQIVNEVLSGLKEKLGANLFSCIIYGSAVRGGFVPGVSDLNLLLILTSLTSPLPMPIAALP